jgi:subfamily B ATP-binding cassette protein MsbA
MRALARVLSVARSHMAWLGVAMVCMLMVAGATVVVVYLIQPVYDLVLSAEPAGLRGAPAAPSWPGPLESLRTRFAEGFGGDVRFVLLLVLVAVAVKNIAMFSGRYAMARLGLATVRDLRNLLFSALVAQSPQYFQHERSGQLVSRVISDVQQIHEAVAERVGDLLQDVLTVVVLLVYVLVLQTRLAIATIVLAPLVLAPVVHLSRRLRQRARQSQERMGDVATVLDESIRGMRVIQAFGLEQRIREQFRRASQSQFATALSARVIQATNAPLMETIGSLGAVLLIAYASHQIRTGAITLGEFSSFLAAIYMTYNPIKRLNKLNMALQQAASAAERVFEVIDAPVSVSDRDGAVELCADRADVELDRVWFAYEAERWVLRDLSLRLSAGETVALVGPSGAGKSTIAALVLRFWDVQRGQVRVGGADVRDVTLPSLRRLVGLVTQETFLFNDTVEANIRCGCPGASSGAVAESARLANAAPFIEELANGYATEIGEAGVRLSGGQRQRLTVARALLKNPPVLLLDEATSALDPESEQLVQAALETLMRDRTTLVIAHRLATVKRADRIVVLSGGEIVEEGTHAQLLQRGGVYARMVELQDLSSQSALEAAQRTDAAAR